MGFESQTCIQCYNPDLQWDRTIFRQLMYDPAFRFPIPAKTRSREDSLGKLFNRWWQNARDRKADTRSKAISGGIRTLAIFFREGNRKSRNRQHKSSLQPDPISGFSFEGDHRWRMPIGYCVLNKWKGNTAGVIRRNRFKGDTKSTWPSAATYIRGSQRVLQHGSGE